MHTHPVARLVLALLAALAAPPAGAQPATPAELRREIEHLQAETQSLANQVRVLTDQVAALTGERDGLLEQVRALEAEVLRLREAGASDPGVPDSQPSEASEPQAPATAPVPPEPFASPASLLAELERRYQAAFAPPQDPNFAPEERPGPPELTPALRKALELWCAEQSRTLRGPFEWRARFRGLRALDRHDHSAMLTVIDPASGLPIGDTIEVVVPRHFADRLARALGPTGGEEGKAPLWALAGTITARPRLSPDRATPGVFNHPWFVGAYVDFGFDLDWESAEVISEAAPVVTP